MKRTPTDKEKKHLRELVGENGQKAHYFNPESPAEARRYRERRSAKQVKEMRQAAGFKETAERKARELMKTAAAGFKAQISEMRRAAGNPKGLD
ncbi:MAG: hypothetical protein IKS47_00695 [Bacteroidales bacterium]|nr:hypothetical protein [Bacteroidales bacterium]